VVHRPALLGGWGLATEGAEAALQFAFTKDGMQRIIGIYNAENVASGRVPHPRFGHPLRIYEINR